MTRTFTLTCVALATVLAGCEVRSKLFCDMHLDDPRCAGAGDSGVDGSAIGCTTPAQCVGHPATPACDVPDGVCVPCIDNATCSGATPTCNLDDHTCRACKVHADCASDVCLDSGMCADAAQVAYVSPAGDDAAACTQAATCKTAAIALGKALPFVRLSGETTSTRLVIDRPVTFVADPGTTTLSGSEAATFEVATGGDLTVEDLKLTSTSSSGVGVSLPANSTGTATITRCTLTGNDGGAITASKGTLSVTRSTIIDNTGGGIVMGGAMGVTFTIVNNFIVRNGNSSTASAGGALLVPKPNASNTFAFNTVVDNLAKNGAGTSGGVLCDATLTLDNNLVARNFVNNSPTVANANFFGLCMHGNSATDTTVTAFHFKSPDNDPFDYHLEDGSVAIDAGSGSAVTVDFDGEPRPNGTAPDLGADEKY